MSFWRPWIISLTVCRPVKRIPKGSAVLLQYSITSPLNNWPAKISRLSFSEWILQLPHGLSSFSSLTSSPGYRVWVCVCVCVWCSSTCNLEMTLNVQKQHKSMPHINRETDQDLFTLDYNCMWTSCDFLGGESTPHICVSWGALARDKQSLCVSLKCPGLLIWIFLLLWMGRHAE